MELLVPNLSGAKGVYVLSWREVYQFRRLSRDDVRLYEQLSAMPGVTPAAIREAVRAAAAWGMATTRPPRDCDRMMTGAPLLFALLDQLHPGGFRWPADAKLPRAQLEQRIRQVLRRIAPALGPKPAQLTDEVMQLSMVFAGVGMPGQSPRPRLSALLEAVQRLCNSMKTWSMRSDEVTAPLASLVPGLRDTYLARGWPDTCGGAGGITRRRRFAEGVANGSGPAGPADLSHGLAAR